MSRVAVSRRIAAPRERVFRAITDIERFPDHDPDIVAVEFLTEQRSGVGTRFRETRRMKKREMVTELEVTEFETNRRVRMVADTHGTVWDTLFSVDSVDDATELTIEMDARPHKLLPRIMNRFMTGFFRKGIAQHLDNVRRRCETEAQQ